MKGLELPISTVVIIVIALVVLLAIIGLFFVFWGTSTTGIGSDAAKNSACMNLRARNCEELTNNIIITDFDADRDGQFDSGPAIGSCPMVFAATAPVGAEDNLYMLCKCHYGIDSEVGCKKLCFC